MRELPAWRALPSLRLFLIAAVLAIGCIVLGAASASADERPLGQPHASAKALAGHEVPSSNVIKPVTAVRKPVAVLPPRSAVVKPLAAVLKPVSIVLASVGESEPVASLADRVPSTLPGVDEIDVPEPNGQATTVVVSLVATRDNGEQSTTVRAPVPSVALAPSEVAQGQRSQVAPGQTQSLHFAVFAPASPSDPAVPFNAPWSVAAGAGSTGTGGGGGAALADLTDGPHTSAALLNGTLRHDFWVLPRSLANDPSSSPD